MRLRRESFLLLMLLTAACALVGIVTGIATGAAVRPPATPPPTRQLQVLQPAATVTVSAIVTAVASAAPSAAVITPSAPGRQHSLLIIGVDDFNAATPRFEGCWVLTYSSGDSNYYGLSFPAEAAYTVPGLDGTRTLAQVFAEDQYQRRGYAFLSDAIRSVFPAFSFDAELVLDRAAFAKLVDDLGGLSLAGQDISSAELWQNYDAFAPVDDVSRLAYQQQVFEALFQALSAQGWTPAQVLGLITQLPHLQPDPVRAAALAAYAAEAPPLQDAVLNWTTLPPAAQ